MAYGRGFIYDLIREDLEKMKEVVKGLYHKYLNGGLPSNESKEIEKYSRKSLAGEYAALLDKH